jgi:TonB family protein
VTIIDGVWKMSFVLLAALAAMPALRDRSAALRHWILATALACSAAIPVLALVAPTWHIPRAKNAVVLAPRDDVRDGVRYTVVSPPSSPALDRPTAAAAAPQTRFGVTAVLVAVWAVGAIASAAVLLVGFVRLRQFANRARPLDDTRWTRCAAEIAETAGFARRVRLLETDHPALLVTWGIRLPTIMLPSIARNWSDDRIRVVLRHELAHVARRDWFTQIAAEIVRGVNWFNPIVWSACRQLRRESERACDDAVLNGGIAPADYAAQLVDLARILSASRRPYLPAPAMARPSGLEGRITAMLSDHVNRGPLTRRAQLAAVVVFAAAAVSVAGLRAQRFATFSGTVLDSTNAVLPNVAVSLSNPVTRTRHEVRTDSTGHFELAGLSDGDYQLAIDELGFAPFRDSVVISGRDVIRTVQMRLGDLHETITVTSGVGRPAADPASRARAREYVQQRMQRVAERCGGQAGPAAGTIGGNILQPTKVADVKPQYPENLQASKVGGVVTLEALIGVDGTVRDVQVVSGDPELAAAAAEAVRQWEFSPTYLNCTPVEVTMGVTANFVAK